MRAIIDVTPGACLKTTTTAPTISAIALKESAEITPTGSARATVAHCTCSPKRTAAIVSVQKPINSASTIGKISIDSAPLTGPNGERRIRSNVPATSSPRKVLDKNQRRLNDRQDNQPDNHEREVAVWRSE